MTPSIAMSCLSTPSEIVHETPPCSVRSSPFPGTPRELQLLPVRKQCNSPASRRASTAGHCKRSSVSSAVGHPHQHSPTASKCGDQDDSGVAMACTFCRQRKIKCNGAKPECSACSTYGRKCRYQAVSAEENAALRLAKRTRRARLAASMILAAPSLHSCLANQQLVANVTSQSYVQSARSLYQIVDSIHQLSLGDSAGNSEDPSQPAHTIHLSEDGAVTHASTPVDLDALISGDNVAPRSDTSAFNSLCPLNVIQDEEATPFNYQVLPTMATSNQTVAAATPCSPADAVSPTPANDILRFSGCFPPQNMWLTGLSAPLPSPLDSGSPRIMKPSLGAGQVYHSTIPKLMPHHRPGAPSVPLMSPSTAASGSPIPNPSSLKQTPKSTPHWAQPSMSEPFWNGTWPHNPCQIEHRSSLAAASHSSTMLCNPTRARDKNQQPWPVVSGNLFAEIGITPAQTTASPDSLLMNGTNSFAASTNFAVATNTEPLVMPTSMSDATTTSFLLDPITFSPAMEPGWRTDSLNLTTPPVPASRLQSNPLNFTQPPRLDLSQTPPLSPSLSPWPSDAGEFNVSGCSRREQRRPDIVNPGMHRVIKAMEYRPDQVSDLARRRSELEQKKPTALLLDDSELWSHQSMLAGLSCAGLLDDSDKYENFAITSFTDYVDLFPA